MKQSFTLHVNGQDHTVEIDPATPLLYVLRNQLQLNGPKFGCGLQQCGACMVHVDGDCVPSCQLPVSALAGKKIRTLEGLAQRDGTLHPVQQAMIDQQAAQCVYCLNGIVMNAVALLENNASPSEQAIKDHLQVNVCRCGIHARAVRAVQQAAQSFTSNQ